MYIDSLKIDRQKAKNQMVCKLNLDILELNEWLHRKSFLPDHQTRHAH